MATISARLGTFGLRKPSASCPVLWGLIRWPNIGSSISVARVGKRILPGFATNLTSTSHSSSAINVDTIVNPRGTDFLNRNWTFSYLLRNPRVFSERTSPPEVSHSNRRPTARARDTQTIASRRYDDP